MEFGSRSHSKISKIIFLSFIFLYLLGFITYPVHFSFVLHEHYKIYFYSATYACDDGTTPIAEISCFYYDPGFSDVFFLSFDVIPGSYIGGELSEFEVVCPCDKVCEDIFYCFTCILFKNIDHLILGDRSYILLKLQRL